MRDTLRAVSTSGEAYVKIAGRREFAIEASDVFGLPLESWEDSNVKSSIKFPVARLVGVRGRCRDTLTSYCCSEASPGPSVAVPHGAPSLESLLSVQLRIE